MSFVAISFRFGKMLVGAGILMLKNSLSFTGAHLPSSLLESQTTYSYATHRCGPSPCAPPPARPTILAMLLLCRYRFFFVLPCAALLFAATSLAQSNAAKSDAEAPSASAALAQVNDTSHCQSLSARDSRMIPLSNVCKFALTFLRELPDFVCEQTTRGNDTVLKAQVTFEHGREHYSDITIDGTPFKKNSAAIVAKMKVFSSGELGTDLVNLFKAPVDAEFHFRKQAKLHNLPASVYSFDIPSAKNTFWAIRDGQGIILRPEYKGELWVEPANGRLLRLQFKPVHLPQHFGISSARKTIDYNEVTIIGAGVFLLPSTSETTACAPDSNSMICTNNVLTFHDCQKFGTKTRIFTGSPEHSFHVM